MISVESRGEVKMQRPPAGASTTTTARSKPCLTVIGGPTAEENGVAMAPEVPAESVNSAAKAAHGKKWYCVIVGAGCPGQLARLSLHLSPTTRILEQVHGQSLTKGSLQGRVGSKPRIPCGAAK